MDTFTAFLLALVVVAYLVTGYRVAMLAFRDRIREYRKSHDINWRSNWRLIARNKGFPLGMILLWPWELAKAVVFFVDLRLVNKAIDLEEREKDNDE